MQEKKPEMANKNNPKKANLLDHHSIKHILDESVSEIVTSRGYVEDVRMSNVRLLMGTAIIVIALLAQFYKKKFPENPNHTHKGEERDPVYLSAGEVEDMKGVRNKNLWTQECHGGMVGHGQEVFYAPRSKDSRDILDDAAVFSSLGVPIVTLSDWSQGSFTSTGLVVSSKLPRFSDMYTLNIASADPNSISAGKPVEFTKDGILVEGLFWKDVLAVIDEYAQEPKKKK
ncbi:hypothetical protein EZV62_025781 [Acer yangbiense]|uniref:Signal peptidase complex subunit 2 n=1 Tax=Acer yangbiense TaxID=1000413 RepID=A0A5C7H0U4_9ROSI|nr:hypothetical protein EZV62_025781 [Acer yangbiense]